MALDEVASHAPAGIRWRYERARARGLPSQRNQAIALATCDVLFLIDDDSFMYQDCAHEVMKIYEADVRRCVAGVAALGIDTPPEPLNQPTGSAATDSVPMGAKSTRSVAQWLYAVLERELPGERLGLPYDEVYPDHPIPLSSPERPSRRSANLSGTA
jgi:hypothetical protein